MRHFLENTLKCSSISLLFLFSNCLNPNVVKALELNLDSFCPRYPLNSRCQNYQPPTQNNPNNDRKSEETETIESANIQVIKIQLDISGSQNEWIHIDLKKEVDASGTTLLTAYHTTETENEILSKLTSGLLSFGIKQSIQEAFDVDIPIPLPTIFKFQGWEDHLTRKIVFIPDGCADKPMAEILTCGIGGMNSINLPKATDIHKGLFTIEYQEKELIRTITFRVPIEE
jgi:hypothetical protein